MIVGGHHSGARAAFDSHIAHGHTAGHGEIANGLAGIFENIAGAAGDADFSDDGENDVLAENAEGQAAIDANLHRLGLELLQALGSQHVFNF